MKIRTLFSVVMAFAFFSVFTACTVTRKPLVSGANNNQQGDLFPWLTQTQNQIQNQTQNQTQNQAQTQNQTQTQTQTETENNSMADVTSQLDQMPFTQNTTPGFLDSSTAVLLYGYTNPPQPPSSQLPPDSKQLVQGPIRAQIPFAIQCVTNFSSRGNSFVLSSVKNAEGNYPVHAISSSGVLSLRPITAFGGTVSWHNCVSLDLNGDGADDFAAMPVNGQYIHQWWGAISQPNGIHKIHYMWQWSQVTSFQVSAGPLHPNSTKDSIIGRAAEGSWWTIRSTGNNPDGTSAFITEHYPHYCDTLNQGTNPNFVLARNTGNVARFVAVSNTMDIPSAPVTFVWTFSTHVEWSNCLAADHNGDGSMDFSAVEGRNRWGALTNGTQNFTGQLLGSF